MICALEHIKRTFVMLLNAGIPSTFASFKGRDRRRTTPAPRFRYRPCIRPQSIAADAIVHSILREVWLRADYWEVGTYVLMPHHLHFLTWPGQVECDLDKWIQYWNSLPTKRLGRTEYGWQRCSFSLNPVRRGLIENAEDWPFQGEIFRVERWW